MQKSHVDTYIQNLYLCLMSGQVQGFSLNKLRRYKLIMDLYNTHKTEDIPTTVILRKHIYPVYPISRTTLYNILCTPVNKLLKEMEERNAANIALKIEKKKLAAAQSKIEFPN